MAEPRDTTPLPVGPDSTSPAPAPGVTAGTSDHADEPAIPTPPEPQRLADTGLTQSFLCDLALKHVYHGGSKEAIELAAELCLPYPIVASLLEWLKGQELVTTRGGSGAFGGAKIRYGATERGIKAAGEALARDGYYGPAPCPP